MIILVILAHPEKTSFNHSIAATVNQTLEANGHTSIFHDLYAERFDPILHTEEIAKDADLPKVIQQHCDEIAAAEGIVIVHPNWWGQPPAILKGWVDRVIRPGVAYEFLDGDSGQGVPKGLLRIKTAVVLNTSNTEEGREIREFGDPLQALWKDCIFGLCGVTEFHRRTFSVMVTSPAEQRVGWLAEAARITAEVFSPNKFEKSDVPSD